MHVTGFAEAEVVPLLPRVRCQYLLTNNSFFCIYPQSSTHLTMVLDLEDRRVVHLARVIVRHINVGSLNNLNIKIATELDQCFGELAVVLWVREVVVSKCFNATLHSADRWFIMESVQQLQVANFLRRKEEIEDIWDSVRCPDPSALILSCGEFTFENVLLVVHPIFGYQIIFYYNSAITPLSNINSSPMHT